MDWAAAPKASEASMPMEQSQQDAREPSLGGRWCTSWGAQTWTLDLGLDVFMVYLMIKLFCKTLVAQDIAVFGAHKDHLVPARSSHCSLSDASDSSWLLLTLSAPL